MFVRVLLLSAMLIFVNYADALDTLPSVPGNNPSIGTLLAAALETAGYQTQAQVLTNLKELLSEVSALIYLGIIFSVLVTVALSGHYRAGLWLLIGPAIFSLLINTTTRASGAEWQFGAFNDRQRNNDLERVLRGSNVQINGEVSYVFHLYNVLISDTMQYLIGIVTNQSMLSQMRFMSRQRVLDDLFGIQLDDANLQSLIQFFFAHCNQEIGYATMVAMGNNEQRRIARTNANYLGFVFSPEYQAAVAHYCERFPARDKPFPPGPWQQYVTGPPPVGLGESPNPDVPVAEFRAGRVTHATVSCAQLWRWTVMGTRRHVETHAEIIRRIDVEPYGERVYGRAFWDVLLRDVGDRVGGLGGGRNLDPCPNVAERFSDAITNTTVNRFFSGMLIRDQLVRDPRGMMIEQFVEHGRITIERHGAVPGSDPEKKEDIIRRLRAQELAESQKYEALWLMMAMPYLQGMILYALATTFPFFAMMTILPGQAGAFFMWMAVWAWAKSWDLGWALVMVADNVIWELMPRVSYYDFPSNSTTDASEFDTPVNMMSAMYSGDHSYSLAAYWMLLSLMIGAVPILTAQAVMGSKKAIAGILIDGLRTMSNKLGSSAADWIAHEQMDRSDVRTVRDRVNSVRDTFNRSFARRQQLRRDFDTRYGGGMFDRAVIRPAVWVGSSLRHVGAVTLNFTDSITPQMLGGQLGTDALNFGRQAVNIFSEHIGAPIGNLAVGVNNNIARPIVQHAPRVVAEMGNYGVGATHYVIGNTGRMISNVTIGWWLGDYEYLRFEQTARLVDTDRTVGPIADAVANIITPQYSAVVPLQWRNLTSQELNRLTIEYERDAIEARRILDETIEGSIEMLGVAEFELRRRWAEIQEVEVMIENGRNREQILREMGQGGLGKAFFGQARSRIEQQMFLSLGRAMSDMTTGINARPEIDMAMAEIDQMRMRAYLYDNSAGPVAVGSVIAGCLVGYFGRDPATGVAIGLSGIHAGSQMNSTAIDMLRVTNSLEADLMARNGDIWLYDSMNSREWYFSQEIRAGISLRGEWWNVPENPYQVLGNASQLASRIRTEAAHLEGALLGDIIWTVAMGVTRGKAILS